MCFAFTTQIWAVLAKRAVPLSKAALRKDEAMFSLSAKIVKANGKKRMSSSLASLMRELNITALKEI